ncbi:MAG TPA: hypothetical protein VHA35_00120 [Dongiaceae bacterium]|nr:hypothetical protein [Dongiaceae bacterium]
MRIVGMAAVLALALAGQAAATAAEAATITRTLNFVASGFSSQTGHAAPKNPVSGSFTFTLDTAKKYTDQSSGLTFRGINIAVTGPIVFSYDPSQSWFILGGNGHANQYVWGTNDFSLSLFLQPTPSGGFFGYSQNGINDSFETYRIALSSPPSAAVARNALLATAPIPGSVPMLLTALLTLAGAGWLRARNTVASRAGR